MTAMVGGHEEDEALGAVSVDDSKKSERKRKRERQRRSDLTNALDELAAIVAQIDPDEHSDAAAQKKRRRKSGEAETGSAAAAAAAAAAANDMDSTNMTRLDLVGRTTMVLRRLQRENSELKRRLDDQHLRSAGDDKVSIVSIRWAWLCSRLWKPLDGLLVWNIFNASCDCFSMSNAVMICRLVCGGRLLCVVH
jgi:Helix-loop-helix DNA-binding domain